MSESSNGVTHHFTVDVEESFHASALESFVDRADWETLPSRVEGAVRQLVDLLAEHRTRATFFVLGWLAERRPQMVRDLAAQGHEIASHGLDHKRVTQMGAEEFRLSVRDSKRQLEDVSGQAVLGYRAPSFSIVRGGEWALDVLVEEGYVYDSSLYPVRRPGYGFAGGHRDPHLIQTAAGPLHEFPPTTLRAGPAILPVGGGAYFRHLPFGFVGSGLEAAQRRGAPGTFYIHPWELDRDQPHIDVPFLTRMRHYGHIDRTVPRLRRLLSRFRFQPIAATLERGGPAADSVGLSAAPSVGSGKAARS